MGFFTRECQFTELPLKETSLFVDYMQSTGGEGEGKSWNEVPGKAFINVFSLILLSSRESA